MHDSRREPSMRNPQATPALAVPRARDHDERELKFAVPEGRVDLIRRRLERSCNRDPEFPGAVVCTIYYDTPDLSSLGEKINSDYLKRKIRVRWYSDLAGRAAGPAFVEAKLRVGNRRAKVRAQLPYSADELAGWDLQDPRFLNFPMLLNDHGVVAHGAWEPVVRIRYRRDRFIEPLSGSRVSLDADIAAVAVNPTFVSSPDFTAIASAVLEVKGTLDMLPLALRPLLQLGMRKRSFSKFLTIYLHMTQRIC